MKSLISLLIVALIAASGQSQTPPAPPPPSIVNAYDVIVTIGPTKICYRAATPTPLDRGTILKVALDKANASNASLVELWAYCDVQAVKLLAPKCKIDGHGTATIHGTWQIDNFDGSGAGCGITLQDGSILDGISVIDDCANPAEDGTAVGFSTNSPPNCKAICRDCSFSANDWTVYNWTPGSTLPLEHCTIVSGRMGVAGEDSGLGQTYTISDCDIYLDATKSQSVGATSNINCGGAYGILFRGGALTVRNTRIHCLGAVLPGPSYAPWTCAVSDYHAAGPANCKITLDNVTCDVSGGDPTKCFDLRITNPQTQRTMRISGRGSANDGHFTMTSALPGGIPFGARHEGKSAK